MSRWRKKPVVVEAWRWCYESEQEEMPQWVSDAFDIWPRVGSIRFEPDNPNGPRFAVTTLEGVVTAKSGDWIVRGVKGELYLVRDDIFRETYKPMSGDAP